MGYEESGAGDFSARRRHLDALQRASANLDNAQSCLDSGAGELLAEELRLAQQQLSGITGEFSSDDLMGEIFSSFCIGK
jgi:tRNA modification GTPase